MRIKKSYFVLVLILVLIMFLFYLFFKPVEITENTDNLIIENNVVDLNSLTLRQKIAQMIIVRGDSEDIGFTKLNIGGIFLDRQNSKYDYEELIKKYQDNSKLKLLISTDLEGAWTPFKEKRLRFPYFSEIKTSQEAYEIGLEHRDFLKKVGFNLNFAPVAEYSDDVYGGRAFTGTDQEIKDKLESYIKGLQENVMGTCKHYPGKGMIKNLHYIRDTQTISKEDLELFELCINNNISAIMIGHQISEGELDSNGKPGTVSKNVIDSLEDFQGLIIADEINMQALKSFYYLNKVELYVDLINAGNEVILDFDLNSKEVYKLILNIEKEVEKGKIDENKIDENVREILLSKGYEIV